jgi:hypothetical protein
MDWCRPRLVSGGGRPAGLASATLLFAAVEECDSIRQIFSIRQAPCHARLAQEGNAAPVRAFPVRARTRRTRCPSGTGRPLDCFRSYDKQLARRHDSPETASVCRTAARKGTPFLSRDQSHRRGGTGENRTLICRREMRDHAFCDAAGRLRPDLEHPCDALFIPTAHPPSDFSNLCSRTGPARLAPPFVPSAVAEAQSNPENAEGIAETISGLKGIALWARTSPRPKR